jgi:hypothetical protein
MRKKSNTESKDLAIIQAHLTQLQEHYDNVHIFVQRREENSNVMNAQMGIGNWFARYGQIKMWCVKSEETEKVETWPRHEEE